MSKIYSHIRTRNLYKVLGTARCVQNPTKKKIIYEQLYESTLKGTNIQLPYGSLWMRDPRDFKKKFRVVSSVELTDNKVKEVQKADKKQDLEIYKWTDDLHLLGDIGDIGDLVGELADARSKVIKKTGNLFRGAKSDQISLFACNKEITGKIVSHIDDLS